MLEHYAETARSLLLRGSRQREGETGSQRVSEHVVKERINPTMCTPSTLAGQALTTITMLMNAAQKLTSSKIRKLSVPPKPYFQCSDRHNTSRMHAPILSLQIPALGALVRVRPRIVCVPGEPKTITNITALLSNLERLAFRSIQASMLANPLRRSATKIALCAV